MHNVGQVICPLKFPATKYSFPISMEMFVVLVYGFVRVSLFGFVFYFFLKYIFSAFLGKKSIFTC